MNCTGNNRLYNKLKKECLDPSDATGAKYNGKLRRSESGKRCQKWGESWPISFRRFCRKIDGKDKPGCFVKVHGETTFQYCAIPACPCTLFNCDHLKEKNETILVVHINGPVLLHVSG